MSDLSTVMGDAIKEGFNLGVDTCLRAVEMYVDFGYSVKDALNKARGIKK